MSDGFISILAIAGGLLAVGALLGLTDQKKFSLKWLVIAAVLVVANDAALTRCYRLVPDFIGGEWNWTGKAIALFITLVVASLPAFGWRRTGLTLAQKRGSLVSSIPLALVYCLFFLGIALAFPSDSASNETLAFQLTMPGLEEEPFYRGVLLLALNEAFRGRIRLLGVTWGWGAILSCALFGLAHAFGYSDGSFSFDPLTMALTAVPSFIAVWLRYRTGSLLLPILLHNFGNAIGHLI